MRELKGAIKSYPTISNESPRPFDWTKTADDVLALGYSRPKSPLVRRPQMCAFAENASSWRVASPIDSFVLEEGAA